MTIARWIERGSTLVASHAKTASASCALFAAFAAFTFLAAFAFLVASDFAIFRRSRVLESPGLYLKSGVAMIVSRRYSVPRDYRVLWCFGQREKGEPRI
jgi:hypothetical protein